MEDKQITYSFINDKPGLVIKADSPEEADKMVPGALKGFNTFRSLLKPVQTTIDYAKKTTPDPAGHIACGECGKPMVERTGEKNGKAWKGLFCPDRDSGHPPVWM